MLTSKKAYSVNEIVKSTGLGKTKIYESIKDGTLAAKKFGRRTIILESDLDKFLNTLPNYEVNKDVA